MYFRTIFFLQNECVIHLLMYLVYFGVRPEMYLHSLRVFSGFHKSVLEIYRVH